MMRAFVGRIVARSPRGPGILVLLLLFSLLSAGASGDRPRKISGLSVVVDLGENLGTHVQQRIRAHLRPWTREPYTTLPSPDHISNLVAAVLEDSSSCQESSERGDLLGSQDTVLLITLGNTAASSALLEADDLESVEHEGYALRFVKRCRVVAVVADGNPMDHKHMPESLRPREGSGEDGGLGVSTGAVTGAYAALELLGFGFFHPLEPIAPAMIVVPGEDGEPREDRKWLESPHWHFRGFHIHTQHPLELTEVLQGFDRPVPKLSLLKSATSGSEWAWRGDPAPREGDSWWLWRVAEKFTRWIWRGGAEKRKDYAYMEEEEEEEELVGIDAGARAAAEAAQEETVMGADSFWSAESGSDESDSGSTSDLRHRGGHQGKDKKECRRWREKHLPCPPTHRESWEDMLPDVDAFFEWCAANRVNRVEWMLLGDVKRFVLLHLALGRSIFRFVLLLLWPIWTTLTLTLPSPPGRS
ncbi:unnamed protein product [Discosporangium mesarthrocarpum]